jgi:hypothetical protein
MKMVRTLVLVGVGCVAALFILGVGLQLTGYVAPTETPPAHVISGTFTLVDNATAANQCVGTRESGWQDVHPGAEVVVRDGDTRLATASLGDALATTWFSEAACAYDFSFGVPTAERYTIEYPGGLTLDYSFDELQSSGWHVAPDCCTVRPAN